MLTDKGTIAVSENAAKARMIGFQEFPERRMARTLYYQWERRVSDYGSNPATPGCIESVSEVAYALLNHYSTRLVNGGFPWH